MTIVDLCFTHPSHAMDVEVDAEADHGDGDHEREEHRSHLQAQEGGGPVVGECGCGQACTHDDR